MTRAELLAFLRRHTQGDTRKAHNLRRDGRAALVVGWDEEQTAPR